MSLVDSTTLYHPALVLLPNIFFLVAGLVSQSRYAVVATVRELAYVVPFGIFTATLYSSLVFTSQPANLHDFALPQINHRYFFLRTTTLPCSIIPLLLEYERAPHDHSVTESGVVADYVTGYIVFVVLFLCEYSVLRLLITFLYFVLLFCDGRLLSFSVYFLLPYFSDTHLMGVFSGLLGCWLCSAHFCVISNSTYLLTRLNCEHFPAYFCLHQTDHLMS